MIDDLAPESLAQRSTDHWTEGKAQIVECERK